MNCAAFKGRALGVWVLAAGLLTGTCSTDSSRPCATVLAWEPLVLQDGPPARFDHSLTVDRRGGRIFLFGGRDAGRFHQDLWIFGAEARTWREVATDGGPSPRSGHSLVFDPVSKKLVLFGGYRHTELGETVFLRELWFYSDEDGWEREFFQLGPSGRAWHAATIAGGRMIVFGGYAAQPEYHLNDVWALDLESKTFTRIATDGGPSMAGAPALLPTGADGGILFFGRDRVDEDAQCGLWSLASESDRWSRLPLQGVPDPGCTTFASDPASGTVLALRGPDEGETGWKAWLFGAEGGTWCECEVEGGPALPHRMGCAADPARPGGWVCFGGARRNHVSGDTWELNVTNGRPEPR